MGGFVGSCWASWKPGEWIAGKAHAAARSTHGASKHNNPQAPNPNAAAAVQMRAAQAFGGELGRTSDAMDRSGWFERGKVCSVGQYRSSKSR